MSDDEVLDKIEGQCADWIDTALGLRFADRPLPAELGPAEVLGSLASARADLDRVEELLARALRLRAKASRIHSAAKAAASDKWDASSAGRHARGGQGTDYSGPRERYADNNLASMAELREERRAARGLSFVEEAVEVLRLAHRGLDGYRLDLHQIIRALTFESRLER